MLMKTNANMEIPLSLPSPHHPSFSIPFHHLSPSLSLFPPPPPRGLLSFLFLPCTCSPSHSVSFSQSCELLYFSFNSAFNFISLDNISVIFVYFHFSFFTHSCHSFQQSTKRLRLLQPWALLLWGLLAFSSSSFIFPSTTSLCKCT